MQNLKIQLTENQTKAVNNVTAFVNSPNNVFILTGAAGTGKTTVVKNIISSLKELDFEITLLAPTNRAVKVLSNKTEILANTVHSEIYLIDEVKNKDGVVIETKFRPRKNSAIIEEESQNSKANKIYIVDESSMISDSPNLKGHITSKNSVLHDLFNHAMVAENNNKIIFVGDSYQLPPIGHEGIAPALDAEYIADNYNLSVENFQLSKILRQANDSYILSIAQDIKHKINQLHQSYNLRLPNVFQTYNAFIEAYGKLLDVDNEFNAIALGWTKKSVLQMNLDVREYLFGNNVNEIEAGDLIYLNSRYQYQGVDIPKGENGKIIDVISKEGIKGGLLFHTVRVQFSRPNQEPLIINTKILTDYLYTVEEMIPREAFVKLAIERSKENPVYKKNKERSNDAYMSAMQAKFGYALTVHKAQGGEWNNVFLHKVKNWRDLRWNYTAVTRAAKNLYSFY